MALLDAQIAAIRAWLGRSLQDLVGFLTEIHALGVNLFFHQQGIDTTTPAGKALFQMMGVFAEFERAMIQDRVRAGLERAKAQGKVLGRPSTDAGKVEAIKADLKAGGVGIIKLAKLHGVGTGTVQRIKDSLAAA
jgi:DNA invertase Pin-like site-specific DNA recombinase